MSEADWWSEWLASPATDVPEANRIASRAKDQEVFGDSVTVSDIKELAVCAKQVATKCEGKIIILLAPIEEVAPPPQKGDKNPPQNIVSEFRLLIATIVPTRALQQIGNGELLKVSTNSATAGSVSVDASRFGVFDTASVHFCEIEYPANSERSPLKIADEVRANAFAYLKKIGLYKEPDEDEKEYDFEDIE